MDSVLKYFKYEYIKTWRRSRPYNTPGHVHKQTSDKTHERHATSMIFSQFLFSDQIIEEKLILNFYLGKRLFCTIKITGKPQITKIICVIRCYEDVTIHSLLGNLTDLIWQIVMLVLNEEN